MNKSYIRYAYEEIPFPKKIVITLPFEAAETQTEKRAKMEAEVDFRNEPEKAKICTVSYAASELARYLRLLGETEVSFEKGIVECENVGTKVCSKEPEAYRIYLSCGDGDKAECGYTIKPENRGMSLWGKSRVGALYAVYTVLNVQGVRWYYPGTEGEIIPIGRSKLAVPKESSEFEPAMNDGRGLDIFAPLKDSAQFLLWMARNRMNITADHVYTAALGDKLGMTFRIGGHMFEPFMQPDLPLNNGQTIWQAHQEWYGLPKDGIRTKKMALKTQFCVSQKSLIDYLAEIMIKKLRGEWKHVDRLDIWGFDCGSGSSCQCEACQKLGNDTDQAIYFLSELRKRIDLATDLHPVSLVACAYEGTKTMDAPSKPIPDNLFARDKVVCYPIHRCYYHDFDDSECPTNAFYQEKILPWMKQNPRLPMIMGEYYNVSKYEDLPLVFTKRICHEIPLYVKWGFASITYMHPPLYNWGVRAINHMLMAELSWNPYVDTEMLQKEYFTYLYGKYSSELQHIYDLIEAASAHVGNYRNFWFSILHDLIGWGFQGCKKPEKQLNLTGHFNNHEHLIKCLTEDLELRREALDRIEKVIAEVKKEKTVSENTEAADTPEQVARLLKADALSSRLYEIRRSLIYGVDEIHLFGLVVREYDLAYRGENDTALWQEIEVVYDKMAGYFYPHRYISKEVEAFCDDALTRSQLRRVIDARRAQKISLGEI